MEQDRPRSGSAAKRLANMTPTPPSTNSSSGASPDNAQFRIVRKRNRVPLSCAPCRHRKYVSAASLPSLENVGARLTVVNRLKCNRGHPCDNCTKRGDIPSCSYAAPSSRKKANTSAGVNGTPDGMQNRIDRLESLVLSLMTSGPQAAGPAAAQAVISSGRSASIGTSARASLDPEGDDTINECDGEDSDVNDVAQSIGIMKVDNGKALYASDAHWYAILADVSLWSCETRSSLRLTMCRLPKSKITLPTTRSSTWSRYDGCKPRQRTTHLAQPFSSALHDSTTRPKSSLHFQTRQLPIDWLQDTSTPTIQQCVRISACKVAACH